MWLTTVQDVHRASILARVLQEIPVLIPRVWDLVYTTQSFHPIECPILAIGQLLAVHFAISRTVLRYESVHLGFRPLRAAMSMITATANLRDYLGFLIYRCVVHIRAVIHRTTHNTHNVGHEGQHRPRAWRLTLPGTLPCPNIALGNPWLHYSRCLTTKLHRLAQES